MHTALRISLLTLAAVIPIASGGVAILERNLTNTMLAGAVSVVFLTLLKVVADSKQDIATVQAARESELKKHFGEMLKQQESHYESIVGALRARIDLLETKLEKQKQYYESQIGHLEKTVREQAEQMKRDEIQATVLNQKYHRAVQDLYRATKLLYALRKKVGEPDSIEIEQSFSALDIHMKDIDELTPPQTQVDGPMYIQTLDDDDEHD